MTSVPVPATMVAPDGRPRRVLMIVENLPVPFDRRVWMEATTLRDAGYSVSIICPEGKGYPRGHEVLDDIHIHRHPLPTEGNGLFGYLLEYGTALSWELALALKIQFTRGFDVIHACNPPDLIFLVAMLFRPFGKKFVFDHHDLCPELLETKFGKRGLQHRAMVIAERLTFALATLSIATNESYRRIAIERGRMRPERVFVVRSGPDLRKIKPVPPQLDLKKGRRFLVGYVGVIGKQEGLDLLVESAAWLKGQGRDDIHFGIVGGGPELPMIEAYAAQLGVADAFTFTGRASDDVLMAMLSTADVCVNPDRVDTMNTLSTMNKIMEYMALGKPIVQFDVIEGRFSALEASAYAKPNDPVDFAQKIVELLEDPDRRAAMGAFGLQRMRDSLSWEHERPKLLAAYDMVFAGTAATEPSIA
ncbi:glycosyltransferase family 4 protein [Sphingomonas sp. R86520]|uniref:glycosyltransferase family 4 protein n=1 Tax=Sphingomonas sp. R86520 TaxID=3093859 RepID=UPI0036D28BE6